MSSFGILPPSIETNYSHPNTRDSFSSFSWFIRTILSFQLALSKLFWLSNFCKNRVNNSSLKRIQRLCLNTAWSWLLLLIVPSIQEEEPPCSLLLHIYNEDDSILRRVYKDKGIATSRLYRQSSHHFLNFRNHYQFEQIWFWIKESVKQKRRFQISDHFESIWWFRKIVRDLRIKLVNR